MYTDRLVSLAAALVVGGRLEIPMLRRYIRGVLLSVSVAAAILTAAAIPATAAPTDFTLKIGSTAVLVSTSSFFSQVAVPVSIKCPKTQGPTQFNVFVSQLAAPGSFGFTIAACTGETRTSPSSWHPTSARFTYWGRRPQPSRTALLTSVARSQLSPPRSEVA